MNSDIIMRSIRAISLRKVVLVGFIALAVIVAVNILLRGDQFHVTSLSLPASNKSVEVINDTLYAYNGSSFYKQAINQPGSSLAILGGGIKLPPVTRAAWAEDNGVLLNFDQSTIGTEVGDAATSLNLSYGQERESTWYFDFREKKLYHVGSYQLLAGAHYYDQSSKVLNYIENRDGLTLLHSFDSISKVDTSVLLSSDFSMVSLLARCYDDSKSICITGRRSEIADKSGIYKLGQDGELTTKYEIRGEVYSIPESPWVVTLDSRDDVSEITDGSIAQYKKATAINLTTKRTTTIKKILGPGNFLYTLYDQDEIAMIGSGGANYVRTGTLSGLSHTSEDALEYTDSSKFEASPIIEFSPMKDMIVFGSTDGQLNLFTQEGRTITTFSKVPQPTAAKKLQACSGNADTEWQTEEQTFTVFLPDTPAFKSEVRRVSDCIAKEKLTHGYLYAFTSVDPATGRPTSY